MSHIATVRLLARDPPAFLSACSRLKLAASVHGSSESIVGEKIGCARVLTCYWNNNPLNHRGRAFLEIKGFKNGFTSSSR